MFSGRMVLTDSGRPNQSLKLTRLSPRLYLGGWGESAAVLGRSQAKPPRSLAPPLGGAG
jgi:hypothetical protein